MSDFRNSTVYQIYIKSFCDSNGDGIGDLNGIRSRLDYLKDLGVDYLWITPFFLSPMNDNGYDVADYYSINPMFGTMDDADALIQEAADRGIGLMFDMVFNHTSTDHEWFQKALAGDPVYMDYCGRPRADQLGIQIRRQRLGICPFPGQVLPASL